MLDWPGDNVEVVVLAILRLGEWVSVSAMAASAAPLVPHEPRCSKSCPALSSMDMTTTAAAAASLSMQNLAVSSRREESRGGPGWARPLRPADDGDERPGWVADPGPEATVPWAKPLQARRRRRKF